MGQPNAACLRTSLASACRGLQRFMSTAVLYFCNLLAALSVLVNLMVRFAIVNAEVLA